eukprot:scpid108481/ scgid19229/ 
MSNVAKIMLAIQIEIRDAKTIIMPAINHTISVIIARVNVTMVIQMLGRRNGPLLDILGESRVTFAPTEVSDSGSEDGVGCTSVRLLSMSDVADMSTTAMWHV